MSKKMVHSKLETKGDNSYGVCAVVFGILSILAATPLHGIIASILGIIFARSQNKFHPNKWARNGRIISIIGLILNVIIWIYVTVQLANNPALLGY